MSEQKMKPDDKVTLNIGGQRFVTLSTTLSRIPGTRLSCLSPLDPSYDSDTQEYYFDHNPQLFNYILDACRHGEVHFPKCLCAPALLKELRFWGLEEGFISACCWKACSDWEEEQKTLDIIERAYGGARAQLADTVPMETSPCSRRMYSVWLFLDNPHSSKMAKIWSFLYLTFLVLSTVVIALETVPNLRVPTTRNLDEVISKSWNTSNPKVDKYYHTDEHPALHYTKHTFSLLFFLELLVRFVTCPAKLTFFRSFFNVIDVLAILPMFLFSIISVVHPDFWITNNVEVAYNVVGVVAIFRAIRILKVVKLSRGLQVIFLAIRASLNEMLLLALLMAIAMTIFSTAVYYTELQHPEQFESIPQSLWWSIVTLTTVGYGDIIPSTLWGRVVAGVCSVCGILIVGLPIPVISNNFRLFHNYAGLKVKLDRRALDKAGKGV